MSISKKAVAIAAGSLFALSIPTSAFAISASCTGAYATTISSLHQVQIDDTLNDDHSARSDFMQGGTQYSVSAYGGAGTNQKSPSRSSYVTSLRACTQNGNPLDHDYCSSWQ